MWNREQNPNVKSAKASLHLITYCTVVTTCSGRGELTTTHLTHACVNDKAIVQVLRISDGIMLTMNSLLTYSFQRLHVCLLLHYLRERLVTCTERMKEREITQWLRVQRRNTQSHLIVKRV